MGFTFFELLPFYGIVSPKGLIGWLVWVLTAFVVAYIAWNSQPRHHISVVKVWPWLLALGALVPVSIFVFTFRLPNESALPIPDLGAIARGPLVPIFAALPWITAIGVLGSIPGVALAAFSGLLLGFLDTRSPFTLLEHGLISALFALALSQRYRTRVFGWFRHPLVASIMLLLIFPILYIAFGILWASDDLATSLDFVLSRVGGMSLGMAIQLFLGSVFLMFLRARYPNLFIATEAAVQPAPQERSIEGRLLFTLGPIVLLAFFTLGGFSWWAANHSAEVLIKERMSSSVQVASESLPFFLETDQNLIVQLAANPRLVDASQSEARSILEGHLGAVPYFEQLFLLDTAGHTLAGYPLPDFATPQAEAAELEAIQLALQGVSLQYLAISPLDASSTAAQLAFFVPVRNNSGQVREVLVGRTNLASNPFAQPILQSLESVNQLGGQGLLVDDSNRIVIAPSASSLLRPYNGQVGESPLLYEDTGPGGARRWINYEPSTGSNWAVVALWPARLSQQLALTTVLPLLVILAGLAIVAYVTLRLSLRSVTGSLQKLIGDSQRIASGDLQASLDTAGSDEVGRLGKALEAMRLSLKTRMEEFQRLLTVSTGVASTIEVGGQIDPILEAALASGASSARLVFEAAQETGESQVGFGKGPATNKYKFLDQQILDFTRKQGRVLITNPARARLKSDKGQELPQSLAAFAMKRMGNNLGALWLAFEDTTGLSQESVGYLTTLADQAALAIDNARLFMESKLARERTEAVLTSSPEPILVTDASGNLQMANPAATSLFGLQKGMDIGKRLAQVISPNEFNWSDKLGESSSIELPLPNGKFYQATRTPIANGDRLLGYRFMFRDVSAFKRAEGLRAEFMSTVSHDLRDPLELISGYLNMLSMVGDLNEHQVAYVQKIEHNIEGITQMVSSLLDTERIVVGGGLRYEAFSLNTFLQEVIREFDARALQKKINVDLNAVDTNLILQADRMLLYRAFYNLLDNAIKFSPRDERVDVEISRSDQKFRISVTDRGAGIAPVDLPAIFDRQMISGKRAFGLGIVKSIIERHNGRVWVESELGLGSSFICELPQKPAA